MIVFLDLAIFSWWLLSIVSDNPDLFSNPLRLSPVSSLLTSWKQIAIASVWQNEQHNTQAYSNTDARQATTTFPR